MGELGNPPQKFEKVMKMASEEGYRLVSHAGEEGPAEYVRDAIDILNVDRIDHGVRSVDDDKLVERIAKMRTPLTLCPLSNLKLCVVDKMEDFPFASLWTRTFAVRSTRTIRHISGDTSTTTSEVFERVQLDGEDLQELAKNSF